MPSFMVTVLIIHLSDKGPKGPSTLSGAVASWAMVAATVTVVCSMSLNVHSLNTSLPI